MHPGGSRRDNWERRGIGLAGAGGGEGMGGKDIGGT